MKAIVIGGTGATGKELVKQLLQDARFDAVTLLVRRPYFEPDPKLREIVVDFEHLDDHRDAIGADVAFSCLGTTLKDAGGKDAQWRVDHDYNLEFATLAKAEGVERFVLLSAMGADPKSVLFYSRMKGTLEDHLKKVDFDRLLILRPGGIERPGTNRKGEKVMMNILKAFNGIGLFKGYAPVRTDRLAKAMIASVFEFGEKFKVVDLNEIKALSTSA